MPRPKIKLSYSISERLLQILSFFTLIGLVALTAAAMTGLPARIPTHFGAGGRADAWGGKDSLLLLPIMAAMLYMPLTLLERFPWIGSYPVEVTKENAARQYRLVRRLMEWLKLIIFASFFYLQWQTVQVAKGLSGGLGGWFLPVFLISLSGVTGVLIYKMFKCK